MSEPRPAAFVMSARRAAASLPTALSFARSAMRLMVRGRWRIEKLRFELDADGRGEVLYRVHGEGWVFHFFLVSDKLPEEVKTDRNFAAGWDAMGVLCQGPWTPEREARLRREVPKQRAGYADYDTLVYARGNRSTRLFEHVVQRLAQGEQPDPTLLAPVGYILRTTAFIANGQLGTRPLAGFEPGHPLRRPYHAQFCSAFALREYVFDLVDHMARARNPNAARLAPAFRRYLGLGNSAATGLVGFINNHPHFLQRWIQSHESVLAQARSRPMDGDVKQRFASLLDKAIAHHFEGTRPPDGVFAAPHDVARDLQRARARFDALAAGPAPRWSDLTDWAHEQLGAEAAECLDAIVIELHPDLIDAADDEFLADERFKLQPEATAAQLRDMLTAGYGWALGAGEPHHFWYRTTKTPRDTRRALRGRVPAFEAETTMDTQWQVRRLLTHLDGVDPNTRVAEIVARHPELRHVVTRVQALHGMPFAEHRDDWLAADFSPFASVRLVLSLKGLEKFEAAPPKSVRGTFMQGAPIAEDVTQGRDGDWPYPLMPVPAAPRELASAQPQTPVDCMSLAPLPVPAGRVPPAPPPELADADEMRRIAPREFARMVQTALQGHGAALGVAEDAALLAMAAQARNPSTAGTVLQHLAHGLVAADRLVEFAGFETCGEHRIARLVAQGASALLAAPAALDLACMLARTQPQAVGVALADSVAHAGLVQELAMRCAQRGLVGVFLWRDDAAAQGAGFAMAGPSAVGPWQVSVARNAPRHDALSRAASEAPSGVPADVPGDVVSDALHHVIGSFADGAALAALLDALPPQASPGFALVCLAPRSPGFSSELFAALRARWPATAHSGEQVAAQQQDWARSGLLLARTDYDALNRAGAALLIPDAQEHRVLAPGVDPLKVF